MADAVPTGLLSLQLLHMQTLITNVTAFQTWTGTATPTLAKANALFIDALLPMTKPLVILGFGDGHSVERIGIPNSFEDEGVVDVKFIADTHADYKSENTDRNALIDFTNNVGAIIDGMLKLAVQGGYLIVKGVNQKDAPHRSNEDRRTQGVDECVTEYSFLWG